MPIEKPKFDHRLDDAEFNPIDDHGCANSDSVISAGDPKLVTLYDRYLGEIGAALCGSPESFTNEEDASTAHDIAIQLLEVRAVARGIKVS